MDTTTLEPILVALIAGAFGFFGGPALAGWFSRRGAKSDARRKEGGDVAVAKIGSADKDRESVTRSYQWIIDNLTAQLAAQDQMRQELNDLGDQLATVRHANSLLRIENDQLKEQLADETAKHDLLKRRVDSLDASNIVLRRELHRHGIAIPALAKEQAVP